MNLANVIDASTTTIIARYDDNLVAAQHTNGYVGIFDASDDDEGVLIQVSDLHRPAEGQCPKALADRLMGIIRKDPATTDAICVDRLKVATMT